VLKPEAGNERVIVAAGSVTSQEMQVIKNEAEKFRVVKNKPAYD
jgi:hypothetical protein